MAVRYQVVLRPVENGRVADTIVQSDGIHVVSRVVGEIAISGTRESVLGNLVSCAADPSTDQRDGLNNYLDLIGQGVDTSAIETEINNT